MPALEMESSTAKIMHHSVGTGTLFHHLTVTPRRPLEQPEDLSAFYSELAASLASHGISPLREVVFAEAALAASLREARRAAMEALGQDPNPPYTLVGCTPCIGGRVGGVQIFGVSGPAVSSGSCTTLRWEGRPVGRSLQLGGKRLVVLNDINGLDEAAAERQDEAAQGERMFRRAAELVEHYGFRYQQVARSWIYIPRLLGWYDAFNRVRNEAFVRLGFSDPGGATPLPASTGIQGAHPKGAACFMDLLLTSTDEEGPPPATPMRTEHQCEAAEYGSAFSRGMRLALEEGELLLVSGTASINSAGETVHLDSPEAQIIETVAAVETLLGAAGATSADIVTGVLFFKTMDVYRAWKRAVGDGKVRDLPAIPVLADVCRDDLLFELEPTGVVSVEWTPNIG